MSPPPTATASPLSSISFTHQFHFFHLHNPPSSLTFPFFLKSFRSNYDHGTTSRILLRPPLASISRHPIEASGSSVCDPELRSVLELAADSELYELERILFGPRGWRPSYRNILLGVGKKLNIPYSAKLSSEDLEVEIFLHLLQEYSRVDNWKL